MTIKTIQGLDPIVTPLLGTEAVPVQLSSEGIARRATVADIASYVRPGWVAWTAPPAVTQGATPGQTVTNAFTNKIDRNVRATLRLAFTSAGTAGQRIIVTLPFACDAAQQLLGDAYYFDAAAILPLININIGKLFFLSTTTAAIAINGNADYYGVTPAVVIAAGDELVLDFNYRSAA